MARGSGAEMKGKIEKRMAMNSRMNKNRPSAWLESMQRNGELELKVGWRGVRG